jgi:hypothetical protein
MFRKLGESKMREKKYQDHLKYIMSLSGSQVVGEGVKDMQLGINFTKNPAYMLQSSESVGIHLFIIHLENKKTI